MLGSERRTFVQWRLSKVEVHEWRADTEWRRKVAATAEFVRPQPFESSLHLGKLIRSGDVKSPLRANLCDRSRSSLPLHWGELIQSGDVKSPLQANEWAFAARSFKAHRASWRITRGDARGGFVCGGGLGRGFEE